MVSVEFRQVEYGGAQDGFIGGIGREDALSARLKVGLEILDGLTTADGRHTVAGGSVRPAHVCGVLAAMMPPNVVARGSRSSTRSGPCGLSARDRRGDQGRSRATKS